MTLNVQNAARHLNNLIDFLTLLRETYKTDKERQRETHQGY